MEMLEILNDLKNNHGACTLKTEFETEGATLEEALRLKNLADAAGLGFAVKIGGAAAVKEIREAKALGASKIVAPMIESAYAFRKFIDSVRTVYTVDYPRPQLFINIETYAGAHSLYEILAFERARELSGIVFGRTDMCGSLGYCPEDVECEKILYHAKDISHKAHLYGKKFFAGGGISPKSVDFLNSIPNLDGWETRKVIFNAPATSEAILKAIKFEMMWLESLGRESERIEVLKTRT